MASIDVIFCTTPRSPNNTNRILSGNFIANARYGTGTCTKKKPLSLSTSLLMTKTEPNGDGLTVFESDDSKVNKL